MENREQSATPLLSVLRELEHRSSRCPNKSSRVSTPHQEDARSEQTCPSWRSPGPALSRIFGVPVSDSLAGLTMPTLDLGHHEARCPMPRFRRHDSKTHMGKARRDNRIASDLRDALQKANLDRGKSARLRANLGGCCRRASSTWPSHGCHASATRLAETDLFPPAISEKLFRRPRLDT